MAPSDGRKPTAEELANLLYRVRRAVEHAESSRVIADVVGILQSVSSLLESMQNMEAAIWGLVSVCTRYENILLLHPCGKCTCGGEGICGYCTISDLKEQIEHSSRTHPVAEQSERSGQNGA